MEEEWPTKYLEGSSISRISFPRMEVREEAHGEVDGDFAKIEE